MDPKEAMGWVGESLALCGFNNGPGKGLEIENFKMEFNNMKEFFDEPNKGSPEVAALLEKSDEVARPFNLAMVNASVDRRPFGTGSGLLGMGSLSVQKGDKVFLLQDAHVPFVLRPVPGRDGFTCIGHCYIYDVMNGEMLNPEFGLWNRIESVKIV